MRCTKRGRVRLGFGSPDPPFRPQDQGPARPARRGRKPASGLRPRRETTPPPQRRFPQRPKQDSETVGRPSGTHPNKIAEDAHHHVHEAPQLAHIAHTQAEIDPQSAGALPQHRQHQLPSTTESSPPTQVRLTEPKPLTGQKLPEPSGPNPLGSHSSPENHQCPQPAPMSSSNHGVWF